MSEAVKGNHLFKPLSVLGCVCSEHNFPVYTFNQSLAVGCRNAMTPLDKNFQGLVNTGSCMVSSVLSLGYNALMS